MARIVGIDYGKKRTGIAATDPLQIIVSPIGTIDTKEFIDYILNYCKTEEVEKIVFGLPEHKDGTPTYLQKDILAASKKIKTTLPDVEIDFADESFSSADAKSIILNSGVRKKKRRDKSLVDKVSAVVILQRYLGHI